MANRVLAVGVAGKYFKIDGESYQCGDYSYKFDGNTLIIWDKIGSNINSPILRADIADIVDGSTSNPFANIAAIRTWLNANFFFIASSGNGGGAGTTINPTNNRLPIRANSTTFGDSKILQDANGNVGVNQVSSSTEKYQFCAHDNGTVFAIQAAGSNSWGTYSSIYNSSNGAHWVKAVGGSGSSVNSTGVGPGGYGLLYNPRNVGNGTGYTCYNVIYAANGDNYFNPQQTTGDQTNGKFGIGYRADAPLPQRLSVSGGGYFSQSVGIGTPTPNAGCILDLNSNSKGLGLTNLTTAEILAIPTAGLKTGTLVFNTTLQLLCVYTSNGWQRCTQTAM